MKTLFPAFLSIVLLAVVARDRPSPLRAVQADSFVESVGINIRLHYNDTPYGNYPAVRAALMELRIRHVRDALVDTTWKPFYERHSDLETLGIGSLYSANPKAGDDLLLEYPGRVRDFEAYEEPNEYDASGGPVWQSTLEQFVARMSHAVRSDPRTSQFRIVGPSFTSADAIRQSAPLEKYFDYGNLHNYFGGRNPGTPGWGENGYGSYDWSLGLARRAWPAKEVITTETGYMNDPTVPDSVPEEISAKYLPRLLLEQYRRGIKRTYIHELLDEGLKNHADKSFGLVRTDFSRKPAFSAVSSMLRLLTDKGAAFAPESVDLTMEGGTADLEYVLFEKRDGRFLLALWKEQLGYDVHTRLPLPVDASSITVRAPNQSMLFLHRYNPNWELETTSLSGTNECKLAVDDRAVFLEFRHTTQPRDAKSQPSSPAF